MWWCIFLQIQAEGCCLGVFGDCTQSVQAMLWRKKPTSGYGYALSILNLYQWLIQVTNKSWSDFWYILKMVTVLYMAQCFFQYICDCLCHISLVITSDNCSIFTKTWWPDIFYCENVRKRHKIYYTKGNKDGFTWICSEDVIRVWSQNSQVHFTSWLNIETCGMYYMCYSSTVSRYLSQKRNPGKNRGERNYKILILY